MFARVVRSGSFRAAAQSLGISPATVSHHIKVLEETMSVRLLERSTRKMALTSAGRAFYSEVRAALSCWERGVNAAERFKEAASGCIVVTLPDALIRSVVVPAVHKLVRTNPDVTVDLRVSTKQSDLLSEGIHVALRSGPLSDSSYGSRLLHRGHRAIFGTPGLRSDWHPKHPSDLSSAPWVHFKAHRLPMQFTGAGEQHSLTYEPKINSDSPQGAVDLAVDGLGFIVLPRIVASAAHDLVPVLPDWVGSEIEFHAVTPSPRPTDRKVQLFIELLAVAFANAENRAPKQ